MGTVEAQSADVGQGSEFVVLLHVLDRPDPEPGPAVSEPRSTTPRRILLVDDNRDAAQSLAELLEGDGHETDIASDGLEALQAAAERIRPDLVLLDIGLPKLNGYEVCRRIREHTWGKNMTLVALTGGGRRKIDADPERLDLTIIW